ncbi:MAG: methionine synthase [Planctomycetes bacterium]|nr:methionine synthase [Planctomycetota bacterium]
MAGDAAISLARFTVEDLRAMLAERIFVFDGAMGTAIQARGLGAADFGGPEFEGCNENLNLTRPDVVAAIHAGYLEVGADVVETNTFGGTPLVLAEYRLGHQALEINRAAARIAREAAARFDRPGRPRLVAGSMGPTTKTISVTGGVTFDAMCDHYAVQAEGLVTGGADLLLVETAQDTLNVKAALLAIEHVFAKLGMRVPIMLSATIEPMGTMLAGQSVEALHTSVEHAPLLSIGLNCATGPDFMTDHVRTLSEMATCAVSCMPNAGLPDEEGHYNELPEGFAAKLARFVEHGWLNVVGGCCGTTAAHIRLLAQLADGTKPRAPQTRIAAATSGVDYLSFDDAKPCIVGERTNVIGSRQFKDLIVGELFEEAAEVGRRQVRGGAHVIDVCLANPDRDELADMMRFLDFAVKKVRVPLMIDSTDARVLEEALKRCQGKAIVNSINLEDGEERFEKVVPLIHRYGAAVVVGCIDEDKKSGMAVTRARKLEIARRSFDLLTRKYGLPARDLIFDALVFPCATGDQAYVGSARETIEGVRLLHDALPECRTILGVSNVSFGLPTAGREVLNTVFLHHCLEAGLDLAIVNSEKLARITHVPEVERGLAEDLIDNRGADPIKAFADYFKAKAAAGGPAIVKAPTESLTLDQRLARCIVEGSKEGLIDDLTTALREREPLAIINGPLMDGMGEVGKLFAANKLIVAEVLQSAEAMKAAVTFLEKHMKHASDSHKGTILLATAKGDVHDIGKNLVEIILGNNGYRVVNLGIKVPPADLIEASAKHKPDLIGLSGLLVKSAQQMVVTAEDLRAAGVAVPMLVGGAALSEKFTCGKITPAYGATVAYAKDAMSGLDLANRLMDPAARPALEAHLAKRREQLVVDVKPKPELPPPTRTAIHHDAPPPAPPDFLPHEVRDFDLDTLFAYVNPTMLYGHHLGLRGRLEGLLARGDAKAEELHRAVTALQDEVVAKKLLHPRALYRFFRAASDGDALLVLSPDGKRVLETIAFPRQRTGEGLCLADFVAPRTAAVADNVCFFVTTAGEGVRKIANLWKDRGDYLRSHALQALALETAEAFAEVLHQKIREMWGIPDPPTMTHAERWKAKYRGVRVSFGYPACPRLDDQAILWRLLEPGRIGVELTDGFMMEPEASVSALVLHHPQAKYFSVGEE